MIGVEYDRVVRRSSRVLAWIAYSSSCKRLPVKVEGKTTTFVYHVYPAAVPNSVGADKAAMLEREL